MGTFQSFRKVYGALKDSTKVGLAKVNSEFKDLDIAIVKATNHVESPPKERHVRKIFAATSVLHPRADVAYCIHALSRRLAKTKSWIVAIKTLIVIHRALREGDPTFREELVNYSSRGNILQMSYFKDDSSPCAWDCSAWVRTYALFLQERMECFRILKYDIEAERLTKLSHGATKVHSRTRLSSGGELLDQLPALQQLLYRLTACQPEGTAFNNYLVQYALALVLKESFKIYCAINDGIINLVDMFFDMPRHDAVKALNIYKRAGQQAENLADFYDFCKGLDLARSFQFPILRQPPPSFLATMEEYIKEAPRISSSSSKRLEYIERTPQSQKTEETLSERAEPEEEDNKMSMIEEPVEPVEEIESKAELPEELPQLISTSEQVDFLGLDEANPKAIELEESNALALAIIPSGEALQTSGHGLDELGPGTSGWELALVTTPSNNTTTPNESKLAGGFDRLLLDSLYDDDAARRQIQQNAGYGFGGHVEDPLGQLDPFSLSNSVPPPMNMQMVMMSQQQHMYVSQYPQQHMSSTNPFGDPYPSFSYQSTNLSQGKHSLL